MEGSFKFFRPSAEFGTGQFWKSILPLLDKRAERCLPLPRNVSVSRRVSSRRTVEQSSTEPVTDLRRRQREQPDVPSRERAELIYCASESEMNVGDSCFWNM